MDDRQLTAEVITVDDRGVHVKILEQTIIWPTQAAPAGVKAGDSVVLSLKTPTEAASDQHERARAILAELLGSGS
jgi:hypothetical protein